MTTNEMVSQLNGQFKDMGGSANAKNQCVDLANFYIVYCLGKDPIIGTNADDFPAKCMDFCDWYPTTEGMEEGDIPIWGPGVGSAGHIAIFVKWLSDITFQSFDENWPLKSPCHIQDHNLNNIEGYLRPKGNNMNEEQIVKRTFAHVFNAFMHTFYGRTLASDPEVTYKADIDYWYAQNPVYGVGSWIGQQPSEAEFKKNWVKPFLCRVCPPVDTVCPGKLAKIKDFVSKI